MIKLNDGEVLEPLEGGLSIIADTRLYRYTSDSVRLADAVRATPKSKILDICSGGGIVALLLAARTDVAHIVGVEIQESLCDMAQRSAEYNNLTSRVQFLNMDLVGYNGECAYDIVTCNPPYYRLDSGEMRQTATADIARHEVCCKLADVVDTAYRALKFGGNCYIVHKCERMSELLTLLSNRGLEPKSMVLYSQPNKPCDSFVVRAKKGAKSGMEVIYSQL